MSTSHALRVLLLGAATLLTVPAFAMPDEGDPYGGASACTLVNGGFEQPTGIRGQGWLGKNVPGWHSAGRDGLIEIWGPGNKADPMNFNIPADTGAQFDELNATSNSPVYQDIQTVPGTTIKWSLAHRARSAGPAAKDVMQLHLGGAAQTPDGATSPNMADGNNAWGHYSGSYTVPAGQTVTRIALVPKTSATGSPSYGNFVDSVEISCAEPVKPVLPPNAPDAVLSGPVGTPLSGSVAPEQAPGSAVTYTVTDPSKLPAGVTIGADGAVTGTPTATGSYQVPVKACDGAGNCADGEAVVVVHDCPDPKPEPEPIYTP